MNAGPTQSYGDDAPNRWRPRPVLARVVRASATLGPVVVALGLGAAAAHWLPATRLDLPAGVWLFLVVLVSMTLVVISVVFHPGIAHIVSFWHFTRVQSRTVMFQSSLFGGGLSISV